MESMFLQLQVHEQDKRFLRFLWRYRIKKLVPLYKNELQIFGAKTSPTCADYTLKRVGIDHEDEFPIAAKAINNTFYVENLINSLETPVEAIEVINKVQQTRTWAEGMDKQHWRAERSDTGKTEINQQKPSKLTSSQIQSDHMCLGSNGKLLTIVFRFAEVLTKKLWLP